MFTLYWICVIKKHIKGGTAGGQYDHKNTDTEPFQNKTLYVDTLKAFHFLKTSALLSYRALQTKQ